MVIHITTDDETRERARQYIMVQTKVSVGDLGAELRIGPMRAMSLIDEFQSEGLISGPDRKFQHNVRQPGGELVEPANGLRDPLDAVILGWIARLVMRLRGRKV